MLAAARFARFVVGVLLRKNPEGAQCIDAMAVNCGINADDCGKRGAPQDQKVEH